MKLNTKSEIKKRMKELQADSDVVAAGNVLFFVKESGVVEVICMADGDEIAVEIVEEIVAVLNAKSGMDFDCVGTMQ